MSLVEWSLFLEGSQPATSGQDVRWAPSDRRCRYWNHLTESCSSSPDCMTSELPDMHMDDLHEPLHFPSGTDTLAPLSGLNRPHRPKGFWEMTPRGAWMPSSSTAQLSSIPGRGWLSSTDDFAGTKPLPLTSLKHQMRRVLSHWLLAGSLAPAGITLPESAARVLRKFPRGPSFALCCRRYAGYDLAHVGNPARFTSRRTVICVTLDLDPVFPGLGAKLGPIVYLTVGGRILVPPEVRSYSTVLYFKYSGQRGDSFTDPRVDICPNPNSPSTPLRACGPRLYLRPVSTENLP